MGRGWSGVLFSVAVLAGCSAASVDDVASSESANTEGRPLQVVKGREWARCWFDVAADEATLSCTSTARGDDPLGAVVEVTAATLGNPQAFQSAKKELDIEQGGTVVVGSFARSSFPVMIMLDARLTSEARALVGEKSGIEIGTKPVIQRPEDLPATRPATLKQPFDLWPVAFIAGAGVEAGFRLEAAEYTRSIAPYKGFFDTDTELKLAPSIDGRDAKGKVSWLVAPDTGAIDLDVRIPGRSTFSLERPGYYTVTTEGVRPATPTEIAGEFPGGAAPTGTGQGPTEPVEPTEPAGPADPDPTCGGDGQPRCGGASCDPGTRFDGTLCVACGDAGETYCFRDPNGVDRYSGSRCNAGTRLDDASGKCVACGDAGETYCFRDENNVDKYGGARCNAGTRLDDASGKCVACGGAGETYCFRDENNVDKYGGARCKAGTRLDDASGKCIACGGEGQTYCYADPHNVDRYGARQCDAGLRLDTTSGKCVR